MKKLFPKLLAGALLVTASSQARAALFITNNTDCDLTIELYAHDFNHATCMLHSNWFVVPANNSIAFNNVTTLNTGTPSWINGPAVLTGGTTAWGWDASKFYFTVSSISGVIGNTGSCVSNMSTTMPGGCNGNNVTVIWTNPGGNSVIDIN
ncbi:hypothetical protein [Taibaiella helva]|uniref:hypothetical protein n=1 Tax=Taibaiella helva TaxID=2301235 RepID=UPI000E5843F1|nr:hypothetical protein [Taibaiella helva]